MALIVHEVLYKTLDQRTTKDTKVYLVFGAYREAPHAPIMNGVWLETVNKDGSIDLSLVIGGCNAVRPNIDPHMYKMMRDQD